jgi:predicted nucleotidyltransferase
MGTLLDALVPSTRASLLVTLLENPDREFYLLELIGLAKKGRGSVQRELQHLLENEILTRRNVAGRTFYRANTACPIFPELKSIVDKTGGILALLRAALASVNGIHVAFVFGSIARGTARSHSDVDLAVIGKTPFRAVVAALGKTHTAASREVNPVVFSPRELRDRVVAKDHFVTELLRSEKRFVRGTADDLEALVGKQVAR